MAKKEKRQAAKHEAGVEGSTPQVFTETLTRQFSCPLSAEDIHKRTLTLKERKNNRVTEEETAVKLRSEAATLKSKAKERDAEACEHENEISRIQEEVDDLIDSITNREEMRPVQCRREYHYADNKIRIFRIDTGELVEEKEMVDKDRQQALGFELDLRQQGKSGWRDKRDRLIFVSDGLNDSGQWASYYVSETNTLKRFSAKGLEPVTTRGKAEEMLATYAQAHGFTKDDPTTEADQSSASQQDGDISPENSSGEEAADELLEQAKQLVIGSGRAGQSLLQRKLGIGYGRASKLLESLEVAGVVGPYVEGEGWKVLVDDCQPV